MLGWDVAGFADIQAIALMQPSADRFWRYLTPASWWRWHLAQHAWLTAQAIKACPPCTRARQQRHDQGGRPRLPVAEAAEDRKLRHHRGLAATEKINSSYVSRVLRLTLLAPEIVEAILDGRQPVEMTLARLMDRFRLAGTSISHPVPAARAIDAGGTASATERMWVFNSELSW
jgi:hypothetical protein